MKKRAEGLQLERILDEEGSEQLAKIRKKKAFKSLDLDMISYFTANATGKKTFSVNNVVLINF